MSKAESKPKTIVEIGLEITDAQLKGIETFLRSRKIPYYVEPGNRFCSLDDLEIQCEGK